MPSEPPEQEAPPPRGWPPGFGRGDDERRALLTLSELRSLRPLALHREAWEVGTAVACVGSVRRRRLGSDGDRRRLEIVDPGRTAGRVEAAGAAVVTPADPGYDDRLNDLRDPPACLFRVGRGLAAADDRVAIVGARRCSRAGREVASALAQALVASGLAVVSGAAHGIDAAAHEGALRAGGRTVAVLGSGIDVLYPASSRPFLEEVAATGTIVSEYPPGTAAGPYHFPARNRIVVALARALVVVEGAARSGSRISVDHALELGREVFAVPGPVTSPLSETPLEMIREGATLIRGADDLLDDLGIERTTPLPPPPDLDDAERVVWGILDGASLPDDVAHGAGLSIPDATTTLLRLELRGLIVSEGGRYRRRHLVPRAEGGGRLRPPIPVDTQGTRPTGSVDERPSSPT